MPMTLMPLARRRVLGRGWCLAQLLLRGLLLATRALWLHTPTLLVESLEGLDRVCQLSPQGGILRPVIHLLDDDHGVSRRYLRERSPVSSAATPDGGWHRHCRLRLLAFQLALTLASRPGLLLLELQLAFQVGFRLFPGLRGQGPLRKPLDPEMSVTVQ